VTRCLAPAWISSLPDTGPGQSTAAEHLFHPTDKSRPVSGTSAALQAHTSSVGSASSRYRFRLPAAVVA
jgi:hypothetical protein